MSYKELSVLVGSGIRGSQWAKNEINTVAIDIDSLAHPNILASAYLLPLKTHSASKVQMDFLLNNATNTQGFHKHILSGNIPVDFNQLGPLLKAEKLAVFCTLLNEAVRVVDTKGSIEILDTAYNCSMIASIVKELQMDCNTVPITEVDFLRSDSLPFVLSQNEAVSKIIITHTIPKIS
ncbi:MAG: hypothetical protein NTV98_03275 [Candidatus Roizmanbacteria bacterium]|nr:hypothetical protein [Candidatus Roizmanbacteria bacterium]